MTMHRLIQEEARYIILRELSLQPDYCLSDALLEKALATFGIARPRAFVHAEIRHLETLGAVTLRLVGETMIPAVTRRGLEHVERRALLDGVKRPGPEA